MKFYVVADVFGSTLGCETSLARARKLGHGGTREGYTITLVVCKPNSDTVRRLLGNMGGFATESKMIVTVEGRG